MMFQVTRGTKEVAVAVYVKRVTVFGRLVKDKEESTAERMSGWTKMKNGDEEKKCCR